MEVYIYRTADVDPDAFGALLEGANGPLRHLRFSQGPLVTVEAVTDLVRGACNGAGSLSKDAIFDTIGKIRKLADLSENAVIVLLSRTPHEGNWFSIGERNSHYMHADDWGLFTATSFRLPVTFLLASNMIMRGMYDSLEELVHRAHHEPRGCILDLCEEKAEISLKMRTADACQECMGRIKSRITMGHLDPKVVIDCFRLMDKVRRDLMFRRRWRLNPEPGRLTISGAAQEVDLPSMRISLSPIQRALYQFFLLHPDGVRLVDLPDAHHLRTLTDLYLPIATTGDTRADQERTIRRVAENTDGRLGQHLSVIRRKFREALGFDDAEPYLVNGRPGECFGIPLSRKYVNWIDRDGEVVQIPAPEKM